MNAFLMVQLLFSVSWFCVAFFLAVRVNAWLAAKTRREDAEAELVRFDRELRRSIARGESFRG